MIKRKIIILTIIFLFIFLIPCQTLSANITNSEIRLSDSRPNQSSIYDFEGDLSGQAIKCIYVDFCTTPDGNCFGPTGLTTTGADKANSQLWHGFTYNNWIYTSIDANTFKITSLIADSPANDASWAIQNIINPNSTGIYFARINTYANNDCTDLVDNGVVGFYISEGVGVFAVVPARGGGPTSNPVPTLTSINPSSKIVGSDGFVMTLEGTNFIPSSVVRFNGSNRPTTYLNQNTLLAEISASDLTTAGYFNITVFNPGPGGGESNPLIFTVNNPLPILDSISPSSKIVGSAGFILTVYGSNFVSNSVVRFNGSDRITYYFNSNLLRAEIPSSDLERAGNFYITVFNPGPGGGVSAQSLVFSVVYPLPILNSISPSFKTVGSDGFLMTLTGTNFFPNSVVRFNGSNRQTIYLNSETLQAQILASDLEDVGNYPITVFNPSPGGGQSNALIFRVIPEEIPPEEIPPEEIPPEEIPPEEILPEEKLPEERPPEERLPEEKLPEEKPPEEKLPEEIPEPIILKPLDGTITNQPTVLVQGLSLANQSIDILLNKEKVKTVVSDNQGKFELTLKLEEGIYVINAVLKGKKSKDVKLTIDLTPPEPPKLLKVKVINQEPLIEKIKATILIKGECSADTVSLKIVINHSEFIFAPLSQKWERKFILDLSEGDYQVYALAYDLANNESKPSNILTFKIGITPVKKFIEETIKSIKKIKENPAVEKIVEETSQITLPAITAFSIVATTSTMASAGLSLFRFLSLFYLLFTQPYVLIFSKRRRGWGVVYDSLTKQPVDLAIVRLFDEKTNRLIRTKITDKEGRYIFIVNPGLYKITVYKPEYKFPSVILKDFKEDFRYLNLYHGEKIEVFERKTIINPNIPIDPEKKIKPDTWLIRDYLFSILKQAIPISAFILSFLFYMIEPHPYFLIFFFLNLLLYLIILYLTPRPKKDWGIVYEKKTKKPLPLAVVRIFEAEFNKLLDQQVTNIKGQYGFLVGGRKFYLTYSKSGYKEKKSQILDFEKKEKGSVVGLDVYLEQIEKNLKGGQDF